MKYLVPILAIAALIAVVVTLVRRSRRLGADTYQRKLDGAQQSRDNSFLYAGALVASADHERHDSQGADCAPQSDSGASCSDAGAGADGGGSS
jgi:hypothetical protein